MYVGWVYKTLYYIKSIQYFYHSLHMYRFIRIIHVKIKITYDKKFIFI